MLIEMFAPRSKSKEIRSTEHFGLGGDQSPSEVPITNKQHKQDHQHLVAVVQFPTHLFPMPFVAIRYTTPDLLSKILEAERGNYAFIAKRNFFCHS